MQTVSQAHLLSFLDWNRDKGRELKHLRNLQPPDYATYEALVRAYASEMEIEFESKELKGLRSNRSYEALCTSVVDDRKTDDDFDLTMSGTHEKLTPRHFAERYAETQNRGFLFFTMMDSTQYHFVHEYFEELGALTGNAIDIAFYSNREQPRGEYKAFPSMYWFKKKRFNQSDIPVFLLYSSKGQIEIGHQNGRFDPYFFRQMFRTVADFFLPLDRPATQRELESLRQKLEDLRRQPEVLPPRRTRWALIGVVVSGLVGVIALLANLQPATVAACGIARAIGMSVCADQ